MNTARGAAPPAGDDMTSTNPPGAFDFDHVTVSRVFRDYGRRRALSRVSVELRAGEIVGLLGANGAGKSTLLGVLATLITPSAGSVRYGGRSPRDLGGALRRRIGYLSHELQLYPELTARENLTFFAGLYGEARPGPRVEAALARARLADRPDEPVQRFSRGMRQRLAIERALIHEPRLVLLDEPFTGLDERSVGDLVTRLRGLGRAGRLVVFATHDLDLADGLLDRVVLLRSGRVAPLADGSGTLRERYRAAVAGDGRRGGDGAVEAPADG